MSGIDISPEAVDDLVKRLREIITTSFCNTANQAADRIEQLEAKIKAYEKHDGMDGAIVYSIRELLNYYEVPKAAFIDDHVLNAIVQRNIAELALTKSQAEVAAAYERAADVAEDYPRVAPDYDEWTRYDEQIAYSQECIRALATPDQTAALDAIRAEARAQGMREAAELCANDAEFARKKLGASETHEEAVNWALIVTRCDFHEEIILDAITKGAKA